MAFLEKSELTTVAETALIDKITNSDDDIVVDIIDESISVMKGYLSKHYDVETIFNATGSERHKTVIKYLKAIAIYEIYIRHSRDFNKVAETRYNEAMAWLEKLNTAEFYDKTLPTVQITDSTEMPVSMRLGGNKQYDSSY